MKIWRKGPNTVGKLRTLGLVEDAKRLAEEDERAIIPPGSRIFTSWSPKVAVAHVKSARNAGSVCEALSERTDWLGTGSDEERAHALSLRLCSRCQTGDYGEAAS